MKLAYIIIRCLYYLPSEGAPANFFELGRELNSEVMHKKTLKRGTCLYPFLSPNVAACWFTPFLFNVLFSTCVFNSLAHSSIRFLPCPMSSISKFFFGYHLGLCCLLFLLTLSSLKTLHLFSPHFTPICRNIYLADVHHSSVFHLLSGSFLYPLSVFTPFPTLRSCLSFPILYSFLNYMQSSHNYVP